MKERINKIMNGQKKNVLEHFNNSLEEALLQIMLLGVMCMCMIYFIFNISIFYLSNAYFLYITIQALCQKLIADKTTGCDIQHVYFILKIHVLIQAWRKCGRIYTNMRIREVNYAKVLNPNK